MSVCYARENCVRMKIKRFAAAICNSKRARSKNVEDVETNVADTIIVSFWYFLYNRSYINICFFMYNLLR